jgi:DNA-binding transcriptional regulator of glucitol operon
VRERWLSKRAVFLHLAALLIVPGCALGAWWQITRAEDGNGLSYLYSVEWPIFAILGLYFWWMLIHTDYDNVGLRGMQKMAQADADTVAEAGTATPAVAPAVPVSAREVEDDPELAAYNARLAELSTQGPKTWRSPEPLVVRRPR